MKKLSRREFIAYTAALGGAALIRPRRALALTDVTAALNAGPWPVTASDLAMLGPPPYTLSGDVAVPFLSIDGVTPIEAILHIDQDDFHFDLDGHTISISAPAPTVRAAAIFASDQRGITIENGTIEGCHTAIYLHHGVATNSGRHVIDSITINNCHSCGIIIEGDACVLRNNTITSSVRSQTYDVFGCDAILGIGITRSYGSLVWNNTIDLSDSLDNQGSLGMYFGAGCRDVVVLDNTVSNADLGVVFDASQGATGEYRGNTTGTFYAGGKDLGGNT